MRAGPAARHSHAILVATLVALALASVGQDADSSRRIEDQTVDARFARGPPPADDVAVVGSTTTFSDPSAWPFPRSLHARAIDGSPAGGRRDRLRRPVHRADQRRGPRALRRDRAPGTRPRHDRGRRPGRHEGARRRRELRAAGAHVAAANLTTDRAASSGAIRSVGRPAEHRGRRRRSSATAPVDAFRDGEAWIDYPGRSGSIPTCRSSTCERAASTPARSAARSSSSARPRRPCRTATRPRVSATSSWAAPSPGQRDLDSAARQPARDAPPGSACRAAVAGLAAACSRAPRGSCSPGRARARSRPRRRARLVLRVRRRAGSSRRRAPLALALARATVTARSRSSERAPPRRRASTRARGARARAHRAAARHAARGHPATRPGRRVARRRDRRAHPSHRRISQRLALATDAGAARPTCSARQRTPRRRQDRYPGRASSSSRAAHADERETCTHTAKGADDPRGLELAAHPEGRGDRPHPPRALGRHRLPIGPARRGDPLAGRICAICDVFDALAPSAPTRRRWTLEDALAEIQRARASFDPRLVDAFLALVPDARARPAAAGFSRRPGR